MTQDFGSCLRRVRRRVAGLCNCWGNVEDEQKDKQAGLFFDRSRLRTRS